MGADANLHCYTPTEFKRKSASMRVVHEAVWHGVDLLTDAVA